MLFPPLCFNQLDFSPNLIKSENMNWLIVLKMSAKPENVRETWKCPRDLKMSAKPKNVRETWICPRNLNMSRERDEILRNRKRLSSSIRNYILLRLNYDIVHTLMNSFWILLQCTLMEFRKLIWKGKKKASFSNGKHAEWEGDVF